MQPLSDVACRGWIVCNIDLHHNVAVSVCLFFCDIGELVSDGSWDDVKDQVFIWFFCDYKLQPRRTAAATT